MAIIEETTLIFVAATTNNNKFYRVTLDDTGVVHKTWGRVGTSGTNSTDQGGRGSYDRIIREKTRKGYKPTETVSDTSTNSSKNVEKEELKGIAKRTLVSGTGNTILEVLIDKLVAQNNHAIIEASGGQMKINSDGLITTPLGLVSFNSIEKAKGLLENLVTNFKTDDLNEYLTLVPQKVGRTRGWDKQFLDTPEKITAQRDFLKQLSESLSLHEDRKKIAIQAVNSDENTDDAFDEKYADLFRYKIRVLEDKKEFKRIESFYNKNRKTMHSSSHLKLKRVYILDDPNGSKSYGKKLKKVGNERELWHGTRIWNVLSILRKGIMIRPEKDIGTVQINGKMFGYGAYFSDESTKSLNYSYGYWDGNSRDENCFMFLSNVAMGNSHVTDRFGSYSNNHIQRSGQHDSIFAKGGTSVRNNEMIVWEEDQINMRYLCEFGA